MFAGHGMGLRRQHYEHLLELPATGVDWFEIISENFFSPGGRPWKVLERVRASTPVAMHGVSLCIGDAAPLSDAYVDELVRLAARVEPLFISDHLSWGTSGGRYSHDLLPLPFTEEAIALVVDKVGALQERLRRRVVLENVSSYVTFASSAVHEWDFMNEVAERSGCGLLLDVNNVLVSATNHGFSANDYVDRIAAEHVTQIHVAGHTDCGDYLLDTHVGPVPEAVWALLARFVRRAGARPTLVEWDEQVPEFEVVAGEVQRAREIVIREAASLRADRDAAVEVGR